MLSFKRLGADGLVGGVAAALLLVTLVAAVDPSPTSAADGVAPLRLAEIPFTIEDDCGTCDDDCNYQGGLGHIANANSAGSHEKGAGWHSSCLASGCDDKHPLSCDCFCANDPNPEQCMQQCQPGGLAQAADLAALWTEVRSGRVDPLTIAARYANVEFNAQRRAVQVLGCGGRILMHIPHYPLQAGE